MSNVKLEDDDVQLPENEDRSFASTKLMNKSLGSFSASAEFSASGESPQNGNPTQYLCIPVKADGTTTPSDAFLSPVPPGHVVLSNGHTKMSPIPSAGLSAVKAMVDCTSNV